MTHDQAEQILSLIERSDAIDANRRKEGTEAFLDGVDRQVSQIAQLKALEMNEQTTELLATLVAGSLGDETDPTS